MPRFLFDPKVTYRALLALIGACAVQFTAFVALGPLLSAVFGHHVADIVTGYAGKCAAACSLVIALLGWITAAGRSIVTAVDNPPPTPPAVELPKAA